LPAAKRKEEATMLRLARDTDVNGDLIRGLRQRQPDLDPVRVQDVNLRRAADPAILEWAASQGRALLSQDRKTMERAASSSGWLA
jgi:hypothetical protein